MNMLRKFILPGLLAIAQYKKNKYRYQGGIQLFHVHGV